MEDLEEDNARMKYYLNSIEKLIKLARLPENKGNDGEFIYEQINRCVDYAKNGYPGVSFKKE